MCLYMYLKYVLYFLTLCFNILIRDVCSFSEFFLTADISNNKLRWCESERKKKDSSHYSFDIYSRPRLNNFVELHVH